MVDNLSTEAQIERLQEESRSCTYPTDAAGVKKRYKDTALVLFKVCSVLIKRCQYLKMVGSVNGCINEVNKCVSFSLPLCRNQYN